jgi:predicted transcriptional regulator
MTPKLTPEQREALDQSDGLVTVEDEQTHRRYFLVDEATFSILQRQDDLAAIREGIADMEAGRVAPLDEVMARIRASLGLS